MLTPLKSDPKRAAPLMTHAQMQDANNKVTMHSVNEMHAPPGSQSWLPVGPTYRARISPSSIWFTSHRPVGCTSSRLWSLRGQEGTLGAASTSPHHTTMQAADS